MPIDDEAAAQRREINAQRAVIWEQMRIQKERARTAPYPPITVRCHKACQGLVARVEADLVRFKIRNVDVSELPLDAGPEWGTRDALAFCRKCDAVYRFEDVVQAVRGARRRQQAKVFMSASRRL